MESPEETGQGEKGNTRGGSRAGQTALAENGAEGGKGKDNRERIIVVVRKPCQENDPADAHPSAHQSVLESSNPRMDWECASGCTWSTARDTARLSDS